MIARLTLRYLLLFAAVLFVLTLAAYAFVGREYAALLGPALPTPEGAAAYSAGMRKIAMTLLAFDLPLLLVVGIAAWLFARASLQPLIDARERERIFAADAAHALRSPLATIAAVAQSQRRSASSDQQNAFETIERAALDASSTVGDLLTLARAARPEALVLEPVDIGALVRSVVREFETQARERGIDLTYAPASAIVFADERRMREITRNLIENALRHARAKVEVAVSSLGRDAELCVWNDGEPVTEAEREKIFKRFYRGAVDAAGSGLGLAIVAWVAKAHGGEARIRDGRGGAEFVVRLPLLAKET